MAPPAIRGQNRGGRATRSWPWQCTRPVRSFEAERHCRRRKAGGSLLRWHDTHSGRAACQEETKLPTPGRLAPSRLIRSALGHTYPGNVIGLARTVRPISIIFDRLVDEAGGPIADALLKFDGATLGTTGPAGYFQIDASPGDTIVARRSVDESCQVVLPTNSNPTDLYLDAGTLTCL